MQDIIASLPEHVLNFKDRQGRTIIDWEFKPFNRGKYTKKVTKAKDGHNTLRIIRPYYIVGEIECKGEKMKIIKEKVEGNLQEAIDNKVPSMYIKDDTSYDYPVNSFEDDIYKLLDAGHIQLAVIDGDLKSNGKQYHVDFVWSDNIGGNITSYYNYGRETTKTVVLREPIGPITNNLISLGHRYTDPKPYPDTITSKFIANTTYTNARSKNQDIIDMIDEIRAKIEAL